MHRSRIVAMLLSGVAVLLLAHYVSLWAAIPPELARTSDFAGTYASATLLREGHPSQLYDLPAEEAVLAATGTPADHLNIPFENPPAAAGAAVPLSLLDSATAYRIWSVLQLLLVMGAAAIVTRAAPWRDGVDRWIKVAVAAAGVAATGTALLFLEAQWDGVVVLGLAVAYAGWRAGWRSRSGFALGLSAALAKPHLVLGLLAFMAGRRDWRGLLGAAAGGCTALALSLAVAGPAGVQAFADALLQPSNSPVLYMQSAFGFTESWFGAGAAMWVAGAVLSAVALLASAVLGAVSRRGARRFEPAFCAATALSLFAAPHLLGHDLTLLVPGFIALAAWLSNHTAARVTWPNRDTVALFAAWVLLSLATQQDLGNATAGPPGRITPIALLCFAVVAGLQLRSSGATHVAHTPAQRTAA